jgi:hypothetical protein
MDPSGATRCRIWHCGNAALAAVISISKKALLVRIVFMTIKVTIIYQPFKDANGKP